MTQVDQNYLNVGTVLSEKTRKYDRQLRLWGERGQEALEAARICLIGTNAVGTEFVKNIILPGIGSIVILDTKPVTFRDIGCSFFLEDRHLGHPRGKAAAELLQELNPEVRISWHSKSAESVIETERNLVFFDQFSAVVVTELSERCLLALADHLYAQNKPLVLATAVGGVGVLRLCVREHVVLDSHPDSPPDDTRLDRPPAPFVKLAQHPNNDLARLPPRERAHVPWLILVYKYFELWKADPARGGAQSAFAALASSYKLRKQFLEFIREGEGVKESSVNRLDVAAVESTGGVGSVPSSPTTPTPGGVLPFSSDSTTPPLQHQAGRMDVDAKSSELLVHPGANVDQAAHALNKCFRPTTIPEDVLKLFNDPSCLHLTQQSLQIWVLIRALKDFVFSEGKGALPVRGTLPDMAASSDRFVELQRCFSEQARADAAAVRAHALRLFNELGRSVSEEDISREVSYLCKNASFLQLIRMSSLSAEYRTCSKSIRPQLLQDQDANDLQWFVLLRAAERYREAYARYPGDLYTESDHALDPSNANIAAPIDTMENEVRRFKVFVQKFLAEWADVKELRIRDQYIEEMCRFGGGSLHPVAAALGGWGAHELIKLITAQYVPLNNTLVYNGITQNTLTLTLGD